MFFHFLRIVAETRRTEACKIPWRRERRGRFSLEFFPFVSAIKGIGFRQKRHPTTFVWWYLLQLCVIFQRASCVRLLVSTMATKIKGIYKGFKYISQIFVVKEREMEIGYPTDVKHVAHLGWDGPSGSGNAPSWMSEFNSAPDFSNSALGNPRDANGLSFSTWSSQDLNHSMGHQPVSNVFNDIPPSDLPNVPKKAKRKKKVSTSSPKSSSSAKRSSRSVKSKAVYHELESSAKLQV